LVSRERSVGNHLCSAPPPLVDDLGCGTLYSCSSTAARCSRLTVAVVVAGLQPEHREQARARTHASRTHTFTHASRIHSRRTRRARAHARVLESCIKARSTHAYQHTHSRISILVRVPEASTCAHTQVAFISTDRHWTCSGLSFFYT